MRLLVAAMVTGIPWCMCASALLRGTAKHKESWLFSTPMRGSRGLECGRGQLAISLKMNSMTLRKSLTFMGLLFLLPKLKGSLGLDALYGFFRSPICDSESSLLRSSACIGFAGKKIQLHVLVYPTSKLTFPTDLIYFTSWGRGCSGPWRAELLTTMGAFFPSS